MEIPIYSSVLVAYLHTLGHDQGSVRSQIEGRAITLYTLYTLAPNEIPNRD